MPQLPPDRFTEFVSSATAEAQSLQNSVSEKFQHDIRESALVKAVSEHPKAVEAAALVAGALLIGGVGKMVISDVAKMSAEEAQAIRRGAMRTGDHGMLGSALMFGRHEGPYRGLALESNGPGLAQLDFSALAGKVLKFADSEHVERSGLHLIQGSREAGGNRTLSLTGPELFSPRQYVEPKLPIESAGAPIPGGLGKFRPGEGIINKPAVQVSEKPSATILPFKRPESSK